MNQSSAEIAKRMEQTRAKRSQRMARLSQETDRLTDWREYVRAAPLTSFAVSLLGGVMIANGIFQRTSQNSQSNQIEQKDWNFQAAMDGPRKPSKSLGRSLFSLTKGLLFPIVMTVVRQQITRAVAGQPIFSSASSRNEHDHKQSV
jgi:hypothetical protein